MTEPKIVEFQEQLDGMAQEYIKNAAKEAGVLGAETHDPKDNDGNLVDQRSQGVSEKFVIALNEEQVKNEREKSFANSKQTITQIQIRFGAFVDERTLRSPRTIFTGPDHPFHYTWITDSKKYGSETLGARFMTQPDEMFLEGLLYEGYRRADLRKVEQFYVSGINAVMLQLPRHPEQIMTYRRKGMPVPPPLPPQLRDKFGTVMQAVVRAEDGSMWVGSSSLYVIEKAYMNEKKAHYSALANGVSAHQFDPSRGITLENDSRSGVFEIPLDNR